MVSTDKEIEAPVNPLLQVTQLIRGRAGISICVYLTSELIRALSFTFPASQMLVGKLPVGFTLFHVDSVPWIGSREKS